ncbi:GN [Symbiodinium natans]|uniref:GN protein n=1 Tax=Symbiodinium natans TaxID=878477 RepID=A0A812KH35_9DINO|nr:GN [Symbiodinium natans]
MMQILGRMVLVASCTMAAAGTTACEKALLELMSEDACGNANGPDPSKACTSTCKPLACGVVSACHAGSTVRVEDETGSWTIPAEDVQNMVQELSAEHTSCPCTPTRSVSLPNATGHVQEAAKLAVGLSKGRRTACEKALLELMSEDACGNANGPDPSKACTSTCKPLACGVVSACHAGSTVRVEDETGSWTIPAEDVQNMVQELSAEHTSCPCTPTRSVSLPNATGHVQEAAKLAVGLSKGRRTACEKALLELMSEDACGNANGPDPSKACTSTCKPLACGVVSACHAGSTVRVEDETGSWTIPAEDVQNMVQELSAEHTSCPCPALRAPALRGAKPAHP